MTLNLKYAAQKKGKRINLFLKGNLDLRDSLHSLRINGKVEWNGLNEIARERFSHIKFRLYHEIFTRSDALLRSRGEVPGELSDLDQNFGPYTLQSQFSDAIFDAKPDVFVLSLMPDVMTNMLVHQQGGYLLYPGDLRYWAGSNLAWLRKNFNISPPLSVAISMDNFTKIIEKCREHTDAPILIYNLSSVIPGESVHCYLGLEEALSTRIQSFNLALQELSRNTGISIVDVDRVVACHGASNLKIDALHLNAKGCRLVAEEVLRILEDIGCLD